MNEEVRRCRQGSSLRPHAWSSLIQGTLPCWGRLKPVARGVPRDPNNSSIKVCAAAKPPTWAEELQQGLASRHGEAGPSGRASTQRHGSSDRKLPGASCCLATTSEQPQQWTRQLQLLPPACSSGAQRPGCASSQLTPAGCKAGALSTSPQSLPRPPGSPSRSSVSSRLHT